MVLVNVYFGGYGTEHPEGPSLREIVCVQGAGGVVAGATASCITTPLDTIKTRLQVQVMGQVKRQNAAEIVKKLVAEEGFKGFYRGLGPRFFSMSAWGTSMILAYEYLKRICAKEE